MTEISHRPAAWCDELALAARWVLWLALAGPLVVQTVRYAADTIYYGEYLHWTGVQASRLLIVVLAVTVVRRFLSQYRWTAWLVLRRRDLGIITFLYAVMHALAYLLRQTELVVVLQEALTPGMLTGWISLLLLLVLAATSNDYSVRALGERWKMLHRSIYIAAFLLFAHWIMTAFNPVPGYIHLGIACLLLLLRLRGSHFTTSKT